jgi:hypothetical protein
MRAVAAVPIAAAKRAIAARRPTLESADAQ